MLVTSRSTTVRFAEAALAAKPLSPAKVTAIALSYVPATAAPSGRLTEACPVASVTPVRLIVPVGSVRVNPTVLLATTANGGAAVVSVARTAADPPTAAGPAVTAR